jgi:hypothetical protein
VGKEDISKSSPAEIRRYGRTENKNGRCNG